MAAEYHGPGVKSKSQRPIMKTSFSSSGRRWASDLSSARDQSTTMMLSELLDSLLDLKNSTKSSIRYGQAEVAAF